MKNIVHTVVLVTRDTCEACRYQHTTGLQVWKAGEAAGSLMYHEGYCVYVYTSVIYR